MQLLKNAHLLILVVFAIGIILSMSSDDVYSADRFIVSIPGDRLLSVLNENNRISEYSVMISAGRVYSVMKIPADWVVKVEEHPETPSLMAHASHGAGYLGANALRNGVFTEFLVVESKPKDWGQFEIRVRFTIDIFMEENPQYIIIEKKDILIVPIKP